MCGVGKRNVILGCAELSLLADGPIEGVKLFDPMQAAIDYVVKVRVDVVRTV